MPDSIEFTPTPEQSEAKNLMAQRFHHVNVMPSRLYPINWIVKMEGYDEHDRCIARYFVRPDGTVASSWEYGR